MSGHVFHPGHHELHGVTVVLETHGATTYVGRFDSQDGSGVHLLDVGIHEGAQAGLSKQEFLARSLKFGIRADRKHVTVPAADIAGITRLAELSL